MENASEASNGWDWNSLSSSQTTTASPTPASSGQSAVVSQSTPKKVDPNVESYSGLAIKDRVINATEMRYNMNGRKFYRLDDLTKTSEKALMDSTIDWVTIGVLQRKSDPKTTSSGGSYMIWTLADLAGVSISLFLFNDAYTENWKEMDGSIIAVINPGIIPANEKGSFALKVRLADEVQKIGTSKDFGICRGMSKNGIRCKIAVNISKCHHCVYHMVDKFKKSSRGRMEVNRVGLYRPTLMKGGDQTKNISEGSYGMKATTRFMTQKQKKTMASLGFNTRVTKSGEAITQRTLKKNLVGQNGKGIGQAQLDFLKAQSTQTGPKSLSHGMRTVAKVLGIKTDKFQPPKKTTLNSLLQGANASKAGSRAPTGPRRDVLGEQLNKARDRGVNRSFNEISMRNTSPSERELKRRKHMAAPVQVPKESSIFDRPVTQPPPLASDMSTMPLAASGKAHVDVRKKQKILADKIKSSGLDLKQMKSSDAQQQALKKRILADVSPSINRSPESAPRMQKIKGKAKASSQPAADKFMKAFGGVSMDFQSEAGKAFLQQQSAHMGALNDEKDKQLDKTMQSLEGKEFVSDELQKIQTIEISAYKCKTCKYVREIPIPECGENGHNVRVVKAVKRWFECQKCKNRSTILNARIPTAPCMRCHSMEWKKCSMYREKKGPNVRPEFNPTGEKQVNSLRFG